MHVSRPCLQRIVYEFALVTFGSVALHTAPRVSTLVAWRLSACSLASERRCIAPQWHGRHDRLLDVVTTARPSPPAPPAPPVLVATVPPMPFSRASRRCQQGHVQLTRQRSPRAAAAAAVGAENQWRRRRRRRQALARCAACRFACVCVSGGADGLQSSLSSKQPKKPSSRRHSFAWSMQSGGCGCSSTSSGAAAAAGSEAAAAAAQLSSMLGGLEGTLSREEMQQAFQVGALCAYNLPPAGTVPLCIPDLLLLSSAGWPHRRRRWERRRTIPGCGGDPAGRQRRGGRAG